MQVDLTKIKVGDMLAVRVTNPQWNQHTPRHKLLVVERITAAQVCCRDERGGSAEWRFRKADGKQIGESYTFAEIATPELIEEVRAAFARTRRLMGARAKLNDLDGARLHRLNLTLEQTEALAKAWTEIKAMVPAA